MMRVLVLGACFFGLLLGAWGCGDDDTGGLRLFGGRVEFTKSSIHDNTAPRGGGVYATLQSGLAPALNMSSGTDIHENDALTGDGHGGGIFMSEGTVLVADCSDINFDDTIAGGGAYLVDSTLTIAGDCSEIALNTASGGGGGLYAEGSIVNLLQAASPVIDRCVDSNGMMDTDFDNEPRPT